MTIAKAAIRNRIRYKRRRNPFGGLPPRSQIGNTKKEDPFMQKKKSRVFRTDLRAPLVLSACIGMVLLALLTVATAVVEQGLVYYGLWLCLAYAVVVGLLLLAYLLRYRRVSRANQAAELMTTEISDMFRYVVDIPYAIVNSEGMVKIVSGALQGILQFRSPVCNVALSSF
jgi:hypothetical protein